ncbi:phosphatidate cytidylyltransferase [Mucilaginibacter sp. P25]
MLKIHFAMTEFSRRTFTGTGLVIVIMSATWCGPYSFMTLLLLIDLLSLMEFYRLLEIPGAKTSKIGAALLSMVLMLSGFGAITHLTSWKWTLMVIPVAFSIFVAALYRHTKKPFQGLAITFLGVIIITLPLCCFAAIPFLARPHGSYHFALPAGCFLLLWANDTAAYLSGRWLGRHPLFLRISPKKTWEGSVGGLAAALTVACVLAQFFTLLSPTELAILSVTIVITGTFGDLVKSLLKRSLDIKDSGTILPGHGGMLDRFDSLLGSAPFIFAYLILLAW